MEKEQKEDNKSFTGGKEKERQCESNVGREWKKNKTSSRVRDERLILVGGQGSEECAAMEEAIVGEGRGDGGALGGGRGMDGDRYEAVQQTVGWCLRSTSMLLPRRLSPDYQMARQRPLLPPARCHLLLNKPIAQCMYACMYMEEKILSCCS